MKKHTGAIDRSTALVAELLQDRYWFRFPCKLLRLMSDAEVIMFACLMNQHTVARMSRPAGWDGWFFFRISQVEKMLGYDVQKQGRLIRSLKRRKFIKTCRRDVPAKRYFKINFKRVIKALQAVVVVDDSDLDDMPFDDE